MFHSPVNKLDYFSVSYLFNPLTLWSVTHYAQRVLSKEVNMFIISHLRKRDVLCFEVDVGGQLLASEEVSVFFWTSIWA